MAKAVASVARSHGEYACETEQFRFSLDAVQLPQLCSRQSMKATKAATTPASYYQAQYYRMYRIRLEMMRPRLQHAVDAKYGSNLKRCAISELSNQERCVIIGTIVKHQELRPSVLKQLAEDSHELVAQPIAHGRYIHANDQLQLEDDRQRVMLGGAIDVGKHVTGVVVACVGHESEGDMFMVEDVLYAQPGPQKPIDPSKEESFVLFVSGLQFTGNDGADGTNLMSAKLLQEWITGRLGSPAEWAKVAKIARIVVAGNNISQKAEDRDFSKLARYLTRKTQSPSVDSIRNVDKFLSYLTPSIPVDIMPGKNDPTNHMLPQQPLHKCMFPLAGAHGGMLNLVSNPYQADIDGVRVLGTSGDNLHNIDQYSMSEHQEAIDLLENTFIWQHMAPTAPDTLDCYPFAGDFDPFVLCDSTNERCPDVYFAGNQDKFSHKIHTGAAGQKVLLLTVPRFKDSKTAVLVNLKTFQCTAHKFGVMDDVFI